MYKRTHYHIVGLAVDNNSLVLCYRPSDLEAGGIAFDYCPICGRKNGAENHLEEAVRALVADYGTSAVLTAAGRM